MRRLITILLFVASVFIAYPYLVANAANGSITFGWSYDFTENPDVTKFRLYKDGKATITINKDDCNVTEVPARPDNDVSFPCTNGSGNCTNDIQYKVVCGEQVQCSTAPADFTLTAIDEAGQESDPSNTVHYDPPPKPVTNVDVRFNF